MLRRLLWLSLWLLVLIPPALALRWAVELAAAVPEPEAWRRALGDGPLHLGEEEFLAGHELASTTPLGNALYWGLLSLPGVDVHHLPLFGWVLAVGVVAAVGALIVRTVAPAGRPWAAALLVLGLSLRAFAPSFGGDWFLDARLRVFLPPSLFVLAGVLVRWGHKPAAFWAGTALAAAAPLAARGGGALWPALAPFVWLEARRRGEPCALFRLGIWCFAGTVGAGLATAEVPPGGLVARFLANPICGLARLVQAASWGLPDLFPHRSADDLLLGAALLLAAAFLLGAVWVRARQGRGGVPVWTWCLLFGLGSAAAAADRPVGGEVPDAALRELAWSVWFLPVGVLGTAACVGSRAVRRVTFAGAVLLGLLCLASWPQGLVHLVLVRKRVAQGEAWARLVRPGTDVPGKRPAAAPPEGALARLRGRGLLRRSPSVQAAALWRLPAQPSGRLATARLESAGRASGARLWVEGRLIRGEALILLRRPPQGPAALLWVEPLAPHFGERSFRVTAPGMPPLAAGDTLRAAVFSLEAAGFEALSGTFRVVGAGLQKVDGGKP